MWWATRLLHTCLSCRRANSNCWWRRIHRWPAKSIRCFSIFVLASMNTVIISMKSHHWPRLSSGCLCTNGRSTVGGELFNSRRWSPDRRWGHLSATAGRRLRDRRRCRSTWGGNGLGRRHLMLLDTSRSSIRSNYYSSPIHEWTGGAATEAINSLFIWRADGYSKDARDARKCEIENS